MIKDHPKYLTEIDHAVNKLKRSSKTTDREIYGDYLRFVFEKKLNNDNNVSTSDKAYLVQRLTDKINYLLT